MQRPSAAGHLQTHGTRPVCLPLGPDTGQVDVSGVWTTRCRGAAAGACGAGAPSGWGEGEAVLRWALSHAIRSSGQCPPGQWPAVSVCSGCHSKIPPAGGLKQHTVFPRSGGQKLKLKVQAGWCPVSRLFLACRHCPLWAFLCAHSGEPAPP